MKYWDTQIAESCMETLLHFEAIKSGNLFVSFGILFFIYICLLWTHISDIQIVISHNQIYSDS